MADPNLAEAVTTLARIILALIAPIEKGIVDYCKDLSNMGCKVFTGSLEADLAWSWLHQIVTTAIILQIPKPMRLPFTV